MPSVTGFAMQDDPRDGDGYPGDFAPTASKEDQRVLKRFRRYMRQSRDHVQEAHNRSEENWDFVSATGDQWDKDDRDRATRLKIPALNMNDVQTVVHAIAGREITGRYQPKAYPATEEDSGWNDVVNEYVRHERTAGGAEVEESDAFLDLQHQPAAWVVLKTDLGRNGRAPRTTWETVPIWEMMWDSRARKPNLADREWHCRGKWIPMDTAKRLFPESKAKLQALVGEGDPTKTGYDGESERSSRQAYAYLEASDWRSPIRLDTDEVFVVELEWKQVEPYFEIEILDAAGYAAYAQVFPARVQPPEMLPEEPTQESVFQQLQQQIPPEQLQQLPQEEIGPMLEEMHGQAVEAYWQEHGPVGKDLELSQDEFDDLLDAYREMTGADFSAFWDLERDEYHFAMLAGDHVLDHGVRPEGCWTYAAMCGWPHKKRGETIRYCPVDVVKDAQRWANRFYSTSIELLATAPKNPILYSAGTFKDPADAQARIARPNPFLEVTNPDGVRVLQNGNGMPEVKEFFQFAQQRVSGQLGLNPYALGQVQDLRRTASSAVQSVAQSSSTILSRIFDALRQFRQETTRMLIRKLVYWEPEDLARVVGPKHAQQMPPKETWTDMARYDVRIDEVAASPNEQMETWESLMQTGFLQSLMGSPEAPPAEILIKLFPHISQSDRDLWLRTIQQRQQAAAEAQQAPPEDGAPPPEEQ